MDPAALLKLVIVGSIVLIAFSIGLARPPGAVLNGLANWRAMSRAMLAMFVAMPLFTLLVTWLLPMSPSARVALLALSVSPMPPILPLKEHKLGASADNALGIQAAAAPTSLVAAPIVMLMAEAIFGRDVMLDVGGMVQTMLITIILPLAAGIGLAAIAPRLAAGLARPLRLGATGLLAAGALVVVWKAAPGIAQVAVAPVMLAVVLMTLFGLLVGHALGGPDIGNRHALAVATAARHPGVAIGLAAATGLTAKQPAVAVVLLYVLLGALLSLPYGRWAKGRL